MLSPKMSSINTSPRENISDGKGEQEVSGRISFSIGQYPLFWSVVEGGTKASILMQPSVLKNMFEAASIKFTLQMVVSNVLTMQNVNSFKDFFHDVLDLGCSQLDPVLNDA